jgi:Na+-driven multidrug efflux pump
LFETIANIVFDYGFIFGKLGMPELGFNGAAWASVLAELIGMTAVFIVIFRKKLHIQFLVFKKIRFHAATSKRIFVTSLPLIGQYVLSVFSWLFFYILIEHSGERALAVSNLMRNVFSFAGVFIWAFAATTNTMVSNIIGQGKQEEVVPLIRRIARLSFASAVLLFIVLNLFARPLLTVFGLSDDFVAAGVPVLRMVSVGILLMSVSVVFLNAVTGTGNTKVNLLIELAAIFNYVIYTSLVIEVYELGLLWAWASELVYWITILSIAYWYLQTNRWKNKNI